MTPTFRTRRRGGSDGFETFSIYEVLPAILELWAINAQTTAKSKKK